MISNINEIDEYDWGLWVWETPDGQWLGDDEGNIMNVFATVENRAARNALADAARYHGEPEGKPVFLPGRRPIDEEELQHQIFRHKMGLIPDELDTGALNDEIQERKLRRNE